MPPPPQQNATVPRGALAIKPLPEEGDAGMFGAGVDGPGGLMDCFRRVRFCDQLDSENVPAMTGLGPAGLQRQASAGGPPKRQRFLFGFDDWYTGQMARICVG